MMPGPFTPSVYVLGPLSRASPATTLPLSSITLPPPPCRPTPAVVAVLPSPPRGGSGGILLISAGKTGVDAVGARPPAASTICGRASEHASCGAAKERRELASAKASPVSTTTGPRGTRAAPDAGASGGRCVAGSTPRAWDRARTNAAELRFRSNFPSENAHGRRHWGGDRPPSSCSRLLCPWVARVRPPARRNAATRCTRTHLIPRAPGPPPGDPWRAFSRRPRGFAG